MYRTERYEAEVSVEEYLEACVAVEEFLQYCKHCRNYGKLWSCPPYEFSPEDYWRRYDRLYILGYKLLFDQVSEAQYAEALNREKRRMNEELFQLEAAEPGSISLSAGCCIECLEGSCERMSGRPCRCPERMRYSLESLGANVGLTVRRYLKQNLLWIEEGQLPEYYILVGGLLKPQR